MTFTLFHSDCLNVDLHDIHLLYLDPPFSHQGEDIYYGVGAFFQDYLHFMRERITHLKTILAPNANFVLHADQKAIHYLKVICDEVFGRENFRDEIIWCYSSPSVAKKHFPKKHDTILRYVVGDPVFHPIFVPHTAKLSVGGKSSWNPDAKLEDYTEKGKRLEDFWTDIPSLCRNEKERLGYPTQKPIKLMKRIVEAYSNEGQNVFDPFMGSGSFLAAGLELKRNVFGADVSVEALKLTEQRLKELVIE